jgi:hypothetical protein
VRIGGQVNGVVFFPSENLPKRKKDEKKMEIEEKQKRCR